MRNSGWNDLARFILTLVFYSWMVIFALILIVKGYIHYGMIAICFLVMLFLINHVDTNGQG
jgi:hypothetical protein